MDATFKGAARRLDDIDLPRIGHRIGVGEDELHAFLEVEAAGSGFDSQGRPKMLFEPHVFYRNLSGAKRDLAVKMGLAYKSWGAKPYPRDSYPRLTQAMSIDETAALKAASWGLGQILGENHKMVGYATPQAMVTAFMADEENHVDAIVEFLIANKIDDDLRAHRWDKVASVYNGPGYKKHNYHGRMAAAYAKWAKIPDTPWSPGAVNEAAKVPAEVPATASSGATIRDIQTRLTAHGFPVAVDGVMGAQTRGAVRMFQKAKGLKVDGIVGDKTWAALAKNPTSGTEKLAIVATAGTAAAAGGISQIETNALAAWLILGGLVLVGAFVAYRIWRSRK